MANSLRDLSQFLPWSLVLNGYYNFGTKIVQNEWKLEYTLLPFCHWICVPNKILSNSLKAQNGSLYTHEHSLPISSPDKWYSLLIYFELPLGYKIIISSYTPPKCAGTFGLIKFKRMKSYHAWWLFFTLKWVSVEIPVLSHGSEWVKLGMSE